MKKELLLTLPLAALLAMPAVAQQAPASDTTSPAANTQTQPATTSAPTDQPMQSQPSPPDQASSAPEHAPLTYESRQGFWGKLNPFARKKYVQKQLDPVRGRVNELDELTAANARMIKDVDARASEGIRLASNRANEADQHAVEAGNRAQMAHQTATQATQRLQSVETTVSNIDQYKPVTEAEIRFRPGQLALSKKAKDALDEMAEPLKNQKGYIVEVQGFSSGRGQAAVENSQRMAESIVRYLVLNHDIPVYRIYTLGMGNAPVPAGTGSAQVRRTLGGRVEVAVLKNGAGDLEGMAVPGAVPTEPAAAPSAPTIAPSSSDAAPASNPIGTSNAPEDSAAGQQQPAPSMPASSEDVPPAQPPNQAPR
ncbi:MAG TPA: OmpA family protein [Terriglobales bacterium]|nr:OmpA family protein [Terriglobales bacterium]